MTYNLAVIVFVILNQPRATRSADSKSPPDYSLNCTPLSPITIVKYGSVLNNSPRSIKLYHDFHYVSFFSFFFVREQEINNHWRNND